MSRRWAALLVVVLLITACMEETGSDTVGSSDSTGASTTAAATSTTTEATTSTTTLPPPNEVTIGTDQEPPTLNPYAPGGDFQIVTEIGQAIHAGLTEIDGETLEIIPVLAEAVPSVANGGVFVGEDGTTTVVFRIRDEAAWADGTPVTGEDVVFTYEVISAIEDRRFLTDPYEAITDITADGKVVTLTFAEPTLSFETMFPVLIPAHQVRGSDVMADWNEVPWVSAGPFVFESWDRGKAIVLRRNAAYWRTGPDGEALPHLDRVEFRFIPETDALVAALEAGDVEVASVPPSSDIVDRLRSIDGVSVTVRESPVWEFLTFQFGENNRNGDSLNEHLAFRQAVAHTIDRQALLDLGFWEATRPLDAILDLFGLETARPWSQYSYDPARARDLIDRLCSDLGRDCTAEPPVVVFSTTGNADERPAIARLLVDLLGDAGIEVELELEDSTLFFGPTLVNGSWDVGEWAWVAQPSAAGVLGTLQFYDAGNPVAGDPNQERLTGNYARWGTQAVFGWPTAEFDEWEPTPTTIDVNQGPSTVRDESTERYTRILDEMAATADIVEFATLAAEAEQILADQVVIIPLIARNTVGAVWAERIDGFVHSSWSDVWNIETWRRIG